MFEQTAMEYQPMPLAAIEMISKEPIRLVNTKIASCDGGAQWLNLYNKTDAAACAQGEER